MFRLFQNSLEGFAIGLLLEQRLPGVSPMEHVVIQSSNDGSSAAGDFRKLPTLLLRVKMNSISSFAPDSFSS